MFIDGYQFKLDSATKFFNSLYVHGWFFHPHEQLKEVELIIPHPGFWKKPKKIATSRLLASTFTVKLDHKGVERDLGPNRGFTLQALFDSPVPWRDVRIKFITDSGKKLTVPLKDLNAERIAEFSTKNLYEQFRKLVYANPKPAILDIGGRARSRVDGSQQFPEIQYDVLDIIGGDNVDIVGDAHELSKYCTPESYDGIMSVSVFEHLLMPWKVGLEMNKVLKVGGVALIHTHQTIGMHDLPWDFFRFSSDCWPTIFNKRTGFEIIATAMDSEHYLLPFIIREGKDDAEKSAGFEGSSVLIRKVSATSLDWPVSTSELISTTYPTHEDGNQVDMPTFAA